jgi:hypothetical protein
MQVSGVSGNTAISIGQKIESTNIADLAGKQVTISGWVYTPTTTVPSIVLYYPNSKDNFSSNTVILGAPSLSSIVASTWTYVSFTTTLPTQVTNGLQVEFSFGAATSGVVAMTGMQLESGPVATPFEIRTYGYELALCQRYYQTIDAISFWGMGASGAAFGGTTTIQVMRATPTTVVGNWTYGAAAGGVISATTQRVSIYAIANSAVGVSTSANNVTLTAEL